MSGYSPSEGRTAEAVSSDMFKDLNGLEIHAPGAAMAAQLDTAVDRLVHFEYEITDPLAAALDAFEFFPMAHALHAYLGGLSTEGRLARKHAEVLAKFLSRADGHELTPRENGHLQAANSLLAGHFSAAARTLADISLSYPRDTIALAIGHQVDYLLGEKAALRDRIGAALPFWTDHNLHYPALLAMYAFGLEENGRLTQAEEIGSRAADMDPANVWAIHAVAHTFEMRGLFDQGVRWFDSRRDSWTGRNQLLCHLWWHYCLYLLEYNDIQGVLDIYDQSMAPDVIDQVPAKLVNGSSMLWRLHLRGTDVRQRFTDLAQVWLPRMDEPWLAFNDVHAVMCYVGADDLRSAIALIADREKYVNITGRSTDNSVITAEVGLPVCKALLAFGRGCHAGAFELLYPLRRAIERCGGSAAQRDVIQQTLVEAATRSGQWPQARELADERLAARPGHRF
jgi:hypothetical protein